MSADPFATPQASSGRPRSSAPAAPLSPAEILFSFQGRIRRATYWVYILGATLLFYAAIFMLSLAGGTGAEGEPGTIMTIGVFILLIPFFWVALAVSMKRWHDRGKSGAWVLIAFVPVIGSIWTFVECGCLPGTPGENAYGLEPT